MSKVHAVLLVPAAGDPHSLLKRGPCGARPPTAWKPPNRPWCEGGYSGSGDPACALVLAWDGERVPVACFILSQHVRGYGSSVWKRLVEAVDEAVLEQAPLRLQASMAHFEGTLILLDADGKRVTP